jgi:GntP family gluconate:H+ symporter
MLDPLLVLLIGIVLVVSMIIVLRLNAFLALIVAAIVVSILAPGPLAEKIARVAGSFGLFCGKIGIVIAMAAVIGRCLMDSGAADRIVRSFLRLLGEKRAPESMMGASFVLAVPVFFDTVFYLMVPLARSLWRRTHRNYMLYILAIATGGVITHGMVPPTPGPLLMAANLNIHVGTMILVGAILGVPTAVVGLLCARLMNRWMPIAMRPYAGEIEPVPLSDEELPGLWVSLAPILLPVVLISGDTVTQTLAETEHEALVEEGNAFQWPALCRILSRHATPQASPATRRVVALLPDEVREGIDQAAKSGTCPPRLDTQLQAAVDKLAEERSFLLDPAFVGIPLSGSAANLLKVGAERLPRDQRLEFRKDYQGKALAGVATSEAASESIRQAVERLSAAEQTRLNWYVLESAFPAAVRTTARSQAADVTAVLGNPNLALLISAAIAMFVLVRKRRLTLGELAKSTESALMSAGVIILITAAGGAFGEMLKAAQVGDRVEGLFSEGSGTGVIMLLIGFGIASLLKIAQGSSTVAMVTASAMLAAMGASAEMLGFHPVYLATAIAGGALVCSWMNDSGFWIFARMSVLTEVEALRSWTILLVVLGFTILGLTLAVSQVLPLI